MHIMPRGILRSVLVGLVIGLISAIRADVDALVGLGIGAAAGLTFAGMAPLRRRGDIGVVVAWLVVSAVIIGSFATVAVIGGESIDIEFWLMMWLIFWAGLSALHLTIKWT